MFKYFVFFISMLVGAGIGIFLGLNVVINRDDHNSTPEENDNTACPVPSNDTDEPSPPKESSCSTNGDNAKPTHVPPSREGLIKSKLGEYVSTEADPDEADEILEKMHKQDQLYCTLKET